MNQNEIFWGFFWPVFISFWIVQYMLGTRVSLLQRERTNFVNADFLPFLINNNQAQGLLYVYPDWGWSLSSSTKLQWAYSPSGSLKHPKTSYLPSSIISLCPGLSIQPWSRDWSEPLPPYEISAGESVITDCTNVDPKWSFINWQSADMQPRPPKRIFFKLALKTYS